MEWVYNNTKLLLLSVGPATVVEKTQTLVVMMWEYLFAGWVGVWNFEFHYLRCI